MASHVTFASLGFNQPCPERSMTPQNPIMALQFSSLTRLNQLAKAQEKYSLGAHAGMKNNIATWLTSDSDILTFSCFFLIFYIYIKYYLIYGLQSEQNLKDKLNPFLNIY